MPPRSAPGRGGPRGGGNPPARGSTSRGGAGRGSRPGLAPSAAAHLSKLAEHVKRPNYGTAGRHVKIQVNSFVVTIPDGHIYHYDVVQPDKLPSRFNIEIFKALQDAEKNTFTPKIVYDGRKNAYSRRELPLGETHSRKFTVSISRGGNMSGRPPKLYDITLTKVSEINLEVLDHFTRGEYPHDEKVLTAIMAANVVVRMNPIMKHPFDKRSFYLHDDRRNIGNGLELWRGIFQSIRPTIDRVILNIDLKSGVMYKEGPLLNLCLDFFGKNNLNPAELFSENKFPPRERLKLTRFIGGLHVQVPTTSTKRRTIHGLSKTGADKIVFQDHTGAQLSVAQYFANIGHKLKYPTLLCVQVGKSSMIPMELCYVPRGQLARKQLSEEQVKLMQGFSTIKPRERLDRIRHGLSRLRNGGDNQDTDYVQEFGIQINSEPLTVDMRVIDPPKLRYGTDSKQPTIVPKNGVWNMMDKKFYRPATIERWIIVIYESKNRFTDNDRQSMINSFLRACNDVGIVVKQKDPIFKYENGHGDQCAQLLNAGKECAAKVGEFPSLIVVVLPNGAGDIRNAVKYFGDTQVGVATQCLKAVHCRNATKSYWSNVIQKINVRLGGINAIAEAVGPVSEFLRNPSHATIVMGADVIHPPPGSVGRPSFAAVVGSIDVSGAKYVATTSVQDGREEIILDMKDMCKDILGLHMLYREKVENAGNAKVPMRMLFYRDGVSEGQFQHVLDRELPLIKEACQELKINPKITLIIVGKRHHNQLFPGTSGVSDKSENCPAGSVIDRGIVHPTDFDFILQSHAGILGTSRPSYYHVIHDEIGFTEADALQAISYALCHTYARCTRSVSIPAPVYYADIVCSRAKHHFDPKSQLNISDTATQVSTTGSDTAYLEAFKQGFKKLHVKQRRQMYFV